MYIPPNSQCIPSHIRCQLYTLTESGSSLPQEVVDMFTIAAARHYGMHVYSNTWYQFTVMSEPINLNIYNHSPPLSSCPEHQQLYRVESPIRAPLR